MAEIPSISSTTASKTVGSTPGAPASSQNSGGDVAIGQIAPTGAAPKTSLTDVPVRQAPEAITSPDARSAPVDGKVIASNTQTQTIRIQTAAGQVEVQSKVPLPPDTPVTIQFYGSKHQMVANIVVMSQAAVAAKEMEKTLLPPPPPLKEGQTVAALLLPEMPEAETAPPQARQSHASGNKAPFDPVSPRVAGATPLPQQEDPDMTVSPMQDRSGEPARAPEPSALRKLMDAYLPQVLGGRPHIPATAESSAPDTLDSNLMQITRAQMHAKTAQQTLHPPAAIAPQTPAKVAPSPLQNVVNTLLSLAETAEPQPAALTATAFRQASAPLPQNMYQMTILKILPPQTPPEKVTAELQKAAAQMPKAAQEQPVQAKIEAITPGGFPILKTDDSHFVLRTPHEIPVGSTVIFKAIPMTPEQAMASLQAQENLGIPATGLPPGGLKGFDPATSTTWPALHEAVQLLQQANPAVAQAFTQALPTPTHTLAPAALFFMAALRLGVADNWVGGNVLKTLQAIGKKDIAEKLGSDFSKISRLSKEPLGDDWKAISMPLLHDDKISQLQFYVRQQPDQDDGKDGSGKPATRFILNLHLSRMGEMQLDGFLQKKNFDIVLRSAEKLPFEMRQELMKRFAAGLEQVNMQGGISFQTRQQNWVTIGLPQQSGVLA